ncbi:MAG: UvrD-helicase domain-containing protein [Proteobacteria bacterium]|nr:UvrD-helicase domain-containing protein [Pseudomonadota bacterium]
MTILLADQFERQAALNPGQSFIVQAPAGSGKTELLTQRFLVLLSIVQYPEEIIALTFTRKAANEMRNRILNALEMAKHPEPELPHAKETWLLAKNALEQNANQAWDLLNNPNRLSIQTIDSLCAQLARQSPVLSHLGPMPNIAEEPLRLYQKAARNLLSSLDHEQPWSDALAKLLLHSDNQTTKVETLLINMLQNREQWLPYIIKAKNTENLRTQLENSLRHVVQKNLTQLKQSFPKSHAEELVSLIRIAADHLVKENSDSPIQTCLDLSKLPDDAIDHQNKWLGIAHLLLTQDNQWRKQVNKNLGFPAATQASNREEKAFYQSAKERMIQLLNDLSSDETLRQCFIRVVENPPAQYTEAQWEILEALLILLPVLTAELKLIFQQENQVDFSEISQAALTALGESEEPTDLTLYLDRKIQHLLVDEFQDTSITHYHFIHKLIMGWQENDGRTLFLVGDPMQSIYRFRQAEVGLFLKTWQAGFNELPLKPLQLSVNFRSTPTIVDWNNQIYQHVFPNQENISLGAVTYHPATSMQENNAQSNIMIKSFENGILQAKQVVKTIQELQAQYPNETIAILVRARSHLFSIVSELQQENIKYQAIDIQELSQTTVVHDLFALTQALLHLGDRLAWLSILRAPWCGLKLHDLHTIANHQNRFIIWDTVLEFENIAHLSDDAKERLARFKSILTRSVNQRRRGSLAILVKDTWLQLGGPACLTDATELENADAFFQLLLHHEKGCDIANRDEFIQKLQKLFAKPDHSASERLQIMTIHKSKGLEFDHVILPALEKRPAPNDSPLLLWSDNPQSEGEEDLLLAPIKASEYEDDPIYRFLSDEQREKDTFELSRLLYVATTRTKKTLHLFANIKQDELTGEISKPAYNSFLSLLWPSLKGSFEQNHIKSDAPTEETHIKPHYLKRLPTDWTSPIHVPEITTTHSNPVTSNWNNYSAKHTGTLIHQIFQQLCVHGYQDWNAEKIELQKLKWKNQLLELGVHSKDIEHCLAIIKTAVMNALQDPKAHWIFNTHHKDSTCELPLSLNESGKVMQLIVDRTFVDELGTRWIIDYKTSTPHEESGENLETFIERQYLEYQSQLNQYAKAFSLQGYEKVRLGLYFPLLPAWYEWGY